MGSNELVDHADSTPSADRRGWEPTSQRGHLEARGLKLGYGDVTAVWDADIDAVPGRLTVVVGRNGAGKTTLMRGISGLIRPSRGTVRFDGTDVTSLAAWRRVRRGIGFVQEGKRIFGQLTVEENLSLGLPRSAGKRAPELLDKVLADFPRLESMRRRPAGELSGGQQQMVAIASALAGDPAVLLVDEPSSGLSPVAFDEVLAVISSLKERGLAVLLVEQLVERVLDGVSDHVVILDRGRVGFSGPATGIDAHQVARDFLT
jgi:branched-chain amino acid transport system ATP-binding protein